MGWTSDQKIWTNWGSTIQQGSRSHVRPCFKMMFTPPSKVPQTTRSYHFVAPKSICIHLDFCVKLPSYFCLKDPHVHSPSFSPPCGYAKNIGWTTHQVHRVRYIDFNVATTLESCSQAGKQEFGPPKGSVQEGKCDPLFQGKLGWWNIRIWPECLISMWCFHFCFLFEW